MIKISTIMPVYNMAEYMKDTINSWEEQTLKEKQLICVDDCSTDGTLEVVKKCAKAFGNIKIIELKCNSGAGPARNRGMLEADGQYISFLDADDQFVDSYALEKMYMAASKDDCDICGAFVSEKLDDKILQYFRFRDIDFLDGEYKDLEYSDFQDDYYYQGFIYKKEYLKNKGIEFPNLRRNQDPPFFVKSMYYANRIRVVNAEYYLHLIGHKTVSHNMRTICDSFKGFLMNIYFADVNGLSVLLEKSAYRINRTFMYLWREALSVECPEFWDMVIEANKILERYDIKVNILGYYKFLHNKNDYYDEYMAYVKLKDAFLREDTIILYGAGINGKRAYKIICENDICNVILWVDKNKIGESVDGKNISKIDEISLNNYDYVLITPGSRRLSEEIKSELLLSGVPEKKILEWVKI